MVPGRMQEQSLIGGLVKENCLQPQELPKIAFNANKSKLVITYNIRTLFNGTSFLSFYQAAVRFR